MPTLLHAACGPAKIESLDFMRSPDGSGPLFDDWSEVRLDIDGQYDPDIIGDIRDAKTWNNLDWPQFDAVFCSHAIEHLHLYDAPKALATFRSVLKPSGTVFIIVPNFHAACEHIVEGGGLSLYDSPAGPIFAHEVIYGKEDWTAQNAFQQHKTGYTPDLLRGVVVGSGFRIVGQWFDKINLMIAGSPA